ncbi:hypothetical protein QJS10_CPB17g00748 [Acorus calamus]|uniref:Uncharacterized protein n=1 Tax=Acorus calamus TaxID=4465 RepID=A0AAV9CXU5_ACOCL|nr:hypothetical protein QJS10_CPB17g00748 [Acorus calamus]
MKSHSRVVFAQQYNTGCIHLFSIRQIAFSIGPGTFNACGTFEEIGGEKSGLGYH